MAGFLVNPLPTVRSSQHFSLYWHAFGLGLILVYVDYFDGETV